MAVDVGALRKFQDLWGPVLESIPAVIDAVAKQADLDRGLAEQKRAFEKAKQDVEQVYAQAEQDRIAAQAELQRLADEQAQFIKDAAARRATENEQSSKAFIEAQAKLDGLNTRIASTQAKLSQVDAEYAAKLAEANSAHAAALAAMDAEIKALEDRKAKAEKALETLRAKLG